MTKPVIVTGATKGTALTWTEGDSNFTNLQNATIGITDGTNSGTLDLNDTLTFTAGTNVTLSYNSSTKTLTVNASGGSGITDVVQDTSPQLGGNLDVNGYSIVSVSNGNIGITPNGTGNIQLTPSTGKIVLGSLDFPTNMGTNGQVLTTNGSSAMSWTTISSGGLANIVEDTTPQLGGNLDVNGQQIVSVSNGNIIVAPNGTGKSKVSALNYNEGALYDLGTTGGTVAPDVANGNVQKITLNSALTLNAFTNPVAGQSLTLIIYGGTAYTSITSTMKFAGAVKTLTATAGCIDILSVYYDGTNYFASLGKGFA